ncbi:hypothetical protein FSP39_021664 [Pinctada imbricata]|uniref:AMP-dependent synthetase/ligase domain-containing protein n=1 Tax=Pinctada imbricata TaxID=66713 RepID=A0AA89BMD7_PINIB|nr:hypothetical protein FSP39_021664 [Pinctada imbricata]
MRRLVWSSLIGQSLWRVRSIPRWIHKPQVLSSQCRFNSTDFQQSSGYLRTDISLIPQFGNNNAGNKEKEPVMRKSKIVDRHGIRHQEALIMFSYDLYKKISEILKDDNLDKNPRIAILCENDITYVIAQLAIWLYCGVGVPLCKTHPPSEWKYVIEDAQCSAVIRSLKVDLPVLDNVKVIDMPGSEQYSGIQVRPMTFTPVEKVADVDDPALIIYTSGTTGPPKGVVLSHRNLITNMNDMIQEWEWNSSNYKGTAPDIILHCLPLHHVHGVVNALWTPLFCGAIVYMLPRFNVGLVMKLLATSSFNKFTGEEYSLIWKGSQIPEVSIFMGVPTMYAKLIEYYEEHYEPQINTNSASGLMLKHTITTKFSNMRLMVSGSAALPESIMKKWHQISGHWLLERYGMTEVGMALTNPLNGERIPGKWLSGFVRIYYEEVAPDKRPLAPREIRNDRGGNGSNQSPKW